MHINFIRSWFSFHPELWSLGTKLNQFGCGSHVENWPKSLHSNVVHVLCVFVLSVAGITLSLQMLNGRNGILWIACTVDIFIQSNIINHDLRHLASSMLQFLGFGQEWSIPHSWTCKCNGRASINVNDIFNFNNLDVGSDERISLKIYCWLS